MGGQTARDSFMLEQRKKINDLFVAAGPLLGTRPHQPQVGSGWTAVGAQQAFTVASVDAACLLSSALLKPFPHLFTRTPQCIALGDKAEVCALASGQLSLKQILRLPGH